MTFDVVVLDDGTLSPALKSDEFQRIQRKAEELLKERASLEVGKRVGRGRLEFYLVIRNVTLDT